jgi:hypothetical protein
LRRSTKVCLALGGLFAALSLVWMVCLPRIVERELRTTTGFDVRVAVLKVDPFTGRVVVAGLTAKNPPTYPLADFFVLRELRADVNVLSWFFSDQFVINELDVDTSEIALVRQHDGKSNAGEFMSAFSGGGHRTASTHKPRRFLVKKLHIRLEKLYVADYTGMATDKKTYQLNIDQTYTDVTDPRELLVPGVVRTLYSFGLHHDFAKLLPGPLGQALADTVGGAAHVGTALKAAVQKAGESLKGTIDKLEQSPKP